MNDLHKEDDYSYQDRKRKIFLDLKGILNYVCTCAVLLYVGFHREYAFANVPEENACYDISAKQDLLCLLLAYPEHIVNVEGSINGKVYIVMKSGKRILYDDGLSKSIETKLANPDLQDMMEQLYPIKDIDYLMDEDCDPGRIRVYTLFREVYGGSRESIEKNLINVRFGYQNLLFNRSNGASEALNEVGKELTALMKSVPNISGFIFPTSGTFNYRLISGTGRLSPHSFGTAIDLKSDKRDYWKWTPRKQGQKRLESYPREMVEIFENHNFIWGGKWGHFDILHFEYRPELVIKARYFSTPHVEGKPWYDGVSFKDEKVERCVRLIENLKAD